MADFLTSFKLFLWRSSYFMNLLGLKIPLGLLVRASRAKHVLAFLTLAVVPFYVYCHIVLLPAVSGATHGTLVWQILFAIWVTIPLMVVGSVVLSRVQALKPSLVFFVTLCAVFCFHRFGVSLVQPTAVGTTLLHLMFVYFEDLPVLAWIWCLYHVVKLQDHAKVQASIRDSPVCAPKSAEDKVLIVGNAPTVVSGKPLGGEIDAFPLVVRFNGYSVSQPEFTGSKVDYHFCNGRQVAQAKKIKAVLPLFNASLTHAAYLFFPHMEDASEIVGNLMSSKANAWFVDEERLLALMKRLGLNFWQVPSSGMVGIDAFLSKHPSVTLHGFNFFSGKKIHYFEESAVQLITSWLERFVTHNPPCEKRWVMSLVKEGKASFLAEDAAQFGPQDADQETELTPEDKEKQPRRRPGVMRTILRDGLPSQFSI